MNEIYVQKLATKVNQLRQLALLAPQELSGNLLIYGAGKKGQQIANIISQKGYSLLGFIDIDPKATSLFDFPVKRITEWKKELDFKNITLIIGIHNHHVSVAKIAKDLSAYSFARIMTPFEIHRFFPDSFEDHYWLTSCAHYAELFASMPILASLLSDPISQHLFESLIQFRLTGNYAVLPEPDAGIQYLPQDIPSWQTPMNFVDCGAYTGDTIHDFFEAGIDLKSIIAFEPDHKNFIQLTNFVESLPPKPLTLCIPSGVGNKTEIKYINAEGAASRISTEEGIPIPVISLDDILGNFSPTLIKMDIEGNELDALHGAEKNLKRHRPNLAISIYHKPEDIWEIPNYLDSLNLGYQFFLRCHGHNSFDLVLYAIPK